MVLWKKDWKQCQDAWKDNNNNSEMKLPLGNPIFSGYVLQQHNIRNFSETGTTKAWSIYSEKLRPAIKKAIVDVQDKNYEENYEIGKVPNLHSLVAYSQQARKPIWECDSKDGLTGDHINKAKKTKALYEDIKKRILAL